MKVITHLGNLSSIATVARGWLQCERGNEKRLSIFGKLKGRMSPSVTSSTGSAPTNSLWKFSGGRESPQAIKCVSLILFLLRIYVSARWNVVLRHSSCHCISGNLVEWYLAIFGDAIRYLVIFRYPWELNQLRSPSLLLVRMWYRPSRDASKGTPSMKLWSPHYWISYTFSHPLKSLTPWFSEDNEMKSNTNSDNGASPTTIPLPLWFGENLVARIFFSEIPIQHLLYIIAPQYPNHHEHFILLCFEHLSTNCLRDVNIA